MAPSILLSYVTGSPLAGTLLMGGTASGNAYKQALDEGMRKDKARGYALLVGASEATLQYLLGGVGKLGGAKSLTNIGRKAISNIDNVLLRVGADIGISALGEGVEEGLQEVLDPIFRNMVFDENNEVKLFDKDVMYSAIVGAVVGTFMEGMSIAKTDIKFNNVGKSINTTNKTDELINNALNLDAETDAHKLAMEMKEGEVKPNDVNVGELYVNFAKDGGDTSFVLDGQEQVKPSKEIAMSDHLRALYIADKTNSIVQRWESLGKEGKAAFEAFAEFSPESIEKNPLEFYSEFAEYYNAGINGENFKKFNAENKGTMLDYQQKLVAFNSGKTDAKTSLKAEKSKVADAVRFKKVGTATMDNDVAGLVENDNTASMSSDVKTNLDKVARAFGVKAIIEDEVLTTTKDKTEGSYGKGIVRISKDSADPIMDIVKHELGHRTRELSPAEFRKYRNYVMKYGEAIGKTGKTSFSVIGKQATYLSKGEKLSNEGAMEEIAADFAKYELMLNEDFINDIAKNEPNLAKKFLNWIKDIIATIKEALGIAEPSLERAQQLWENAVRSATKEANKLFDEYSKFNANNDILAMIQKVSNGKFKANDIVFFSNVSNEIADKIYELTGVDVHNFKMVIEARQIEHIIKDHGENGKTDQSMKNSNDIAKMEYTLYQPDSIVKSGKTQAYTHMRKGKNRTADTVLYEKKIGDQSYYVVQAVPDTKAKTLFVVTAFIGESGYKKKDPQLINAERPDATSEIGSAMSSNYSIPNSPENVNNKFSIKENSSKKSTEENLRDIIKMLKEEHKADLKRSKGITVDKAKVNRVAKNFIKDYSSEADLEVVSDKINKLYEFIGNKVDEKGNELNYETLSEKANEIAKEIIEESVTKSNELAEDYPELVAHLKNTNIIVSNKIRRDIRNFDDMKKRNKGRLKITMGKSNVDQVYQELSMDYPEFFSDDIINTSDMFERIVEVSDMLKPVEINPYEGQMGEVVSFLAEDLIERYYEIPQHYTFADKQAMKLENVKRDYRKKLEKEKLRGREKADSIRQEKNEKIAELKKENREKVKEIISKERQKREDKIAELKTDYEEQNERKREVRNKRELRAKIKKHVKALSDKLLSNTDKKHIPEHLKKVVADVLASINLESLYTYDVETGKRVKNGGGELLKKTKAFIELREWYKDIAKESGVVVDPDLFGTETDIGFIDEMIKLENVKVDAMNYEQLDLVYKTVRALESMISNFNKTFSENKYNSLSNWAYDFKYEAEKMKKKETKIGLKGKSDAFFNFDMVDPYNFFSELGNAGKEMWKVIRSGFNQVIRDYQIISELSRNWSKDVHKWTGKDAETKTFETENGDTITMTPAQMMSLYLLNKRDQARDHIYIGGIKATNIIKDGKVIEQKRTVRVTHTDVENIISELTDEQIKVADEIGKFMSTTLSKWGNEVSMEMYGYKKYLDDNYFPIKTDKNYLNKAFAKGDNYRITSMGFTKATTPHANNPIIVDDIFSVFADHSEKMSIYHSFASALSDIERVYNFKFYDESGKRDGTFQESLEEVLTKKGSEYFANLLNDLNMGIDKKGGTGLDALTSRAKSVMVGANKRSAIQQFGSFTRALVVMSPKYLLNPTNFRKVDYELIKKYAPIAQWKDWGFFEIGTGRNVKGILLNDTSFSEKVTKASMYMSGKADELTWKRIWNACENEVKSKNPELTKGDAFYKKVAERFDEIIDRTQVVDSIIHRSQIMRTGDGLKKMATAFMAEPTKNYNLVRSAVVKVSNNPTSENKRFLARTLFVTALTGTLTAALASVIDVTRDDDDDETIIEKYGQALVGIQGDEETVLDYFKNISSGNIADNINPIANIPFLKDAWSLFMGYDVSRMDMDLIADLIKSTGAFAKSFSENSNTTIGYALTDMITNIANILGVPASNLKREIEADANVVLMLSDLFGDDSGIKVFLSKIKNKVNDENKNYWIDMGFRYERDGEMENAEMIYDMLREKGIKEEDIQDRIKADYKKSENFVTEQEKVISDLAKEFQDKRYSNLVGDEFEAKVSEYSEDYAYVTTMKKINDDYEISKTYSWVKKAQDGKKVGISISEYIVAYALTRNIEGIKDKNGETIDNSKGLQIMEKVYSIKGLSDKERKYLFEALGVGKKIQHYSKALVESELNKMR